MSPFPDRARCWIAEVKQRLEVKPSPAVWSPAELDLLRAPACDGVLIRAHLIPKQRIAREFPRGVPWHDEKVPYGGPAMRVTYEVAHRYPDVVTRWQPLEEVQWDRRVWVPMCGGPMGNAGHHGMLDAGGVNRIRLERAWIPEAVEEFAREYGLGWSLEADYGPKETT